MKFDMKKSGFDVEIGEVKFFFETTDTNMMRIMNLAETSEKEIAEADAELAKIDFEKLDEKDPKTIANALESAKNKVALMYDLMLGDGAFDKLYDVYPDIKQLQLVFHDVLNGITDKFEEIANSQQAESEEKAKLLNAKVAAKKKTKKK